MEKGFFIGKKIDLLIRGKPNIWKKNFISLGVKMVGAFSFYSYTYKSEAAPAF